MGVKRCARCGEYIDVTAWGEDRAVVTFTFFDGEDVGVKRFHLCGMCANKMYLYVKGLADLNSFKRDSH